MVKLLGNLKRGMLFVVSAPAGTGKTTLVQMLTAEFSCVKTSVSSTTRLPRTGEQHGVHYHFLDTAEFEKKIAEGSFFEHVKLYNDYYGTSQAAVEEMLARGLHVVLVIDTQGALYIKERYPAVLIFIKPPSIEELRRRLIARKTESMEAIEKRLAWSKVELEAASAYDYSIINDELTTAYEVLRSIFIAEEHRQQV